MFDLDVIPQIFSNSKYCIIYSDVDRNIIGVYTGSEFPGLYKEKGKIESLFEESHSKYFIERIGYCLKHNCSLEIEIEAVNKSYQLFSVTITPIIKEEETLIGYIIKDVTEKAILENALIQKEKRNSLFIDFATEGIIFLQDLQIVDFNQTILNIFDFDVKGFNALSLDDIFQQDTNESLKKLVEDSKNQSYKGYGINSKGENIELSISYEPCTSKLCENFNAVVRISLYEEKNSEKQSSKNIQSIYDASLNLVNAGIWYKDLVNDKLYWSKGVYRIYDYPMDSEPPKDNWKNFIAPEYKERLEEDLRTLIFQGKQFETELIISTTKGETKHIYNKLEVERGFDGKAVRIIGWVAEV